MAYNYVILEKAVEDIEEMKTYPTLFNLCSLFLLLYLFSGCQSEQKTEQNKASEASLVLAITELEKLIETENADELAKKIIVPSDRTHVGSRELAGRLFGKEVKKLYSYSESKISGDMAAVVISIDVFSVKIAVLAKWEDEQWKFFMGLYDFASEYGIRRLGLSDDQLKDALILKEWLDNETQAFKSGIGGRDRLKWYLPDVPDSLVIETFYESPSPAMDHVYMWKIKVENNEMFDRFQNQLRQKPPNFSKMNRASDAAVYDEHPDWWKSLDLKEGKVYQYSVKVVGGGEIGFIFAFFDKNSDYLYIQAGS